MRYLKALGLLFFFVLALLFFSQNIIVLGQIVELRLVLFGLVWLSLAQPLYFVVLGSFFLGGLLITLFFLTERLRLAGELRACRGKLQNLEQEVTSLRNLPLEDKRYPAPGEVGPEQG
jgi:putative membrane protein